MDRGACELQRLDVVPSTTVQAVEFTLAWPRGTTNAFSALLFSTAAPGAGAVACSTFVPDAFTSWQFGFSVGVPGVFVPVPADGVVRGTVPLALPGPGPWAVWAAGFLLDSRGGVIRGATGVAGFVAP
jgi:hypothetical protein